MPNLWNTQTQKPEWVRPENVSAALASGSFVEYEGSDVVTSPAEGILVARPAASAATELAPVVSAGAVLAEQQLAAERAAQDNLAAEALTLVEGGVAGLSAGLLDPADISRDAAVRREVNPVAGGIGVGAGAIGGAALGVGPAGWVARGAGRVASNVAARAGSPAARLAIRETVAGALEGAGFSAGAQVGGALWADRPFSGEAVVSDIGLGAFLGGALAGTKLAAARASRETKSAAVSAADDLLDPKSPLSAGVSGDFRGIGGQWDEVFSSAAARVDALSAAARRGEVPDVVVGPLRARERLVSDARAAQVALRKALRVSGDGDPWARLDEVLVSGTPKRVAAVARALDGYGAAVQRLDDGMRPQRIEMALSPSPVRLGERTLLDPPGAGGQVDTVGPAARRVPAPAPTRLGDPNVAPAGGPGSGFVTETFAPAPRTLPDGTPVPASVDGTAPTGPMAAPRPDGFRRSPAMANVVPGQAVRDFVAAPIGAAPPSPSALADALSARLGRLDNVLIPRGASLDLAEAAGARVEGLGPLGERAVQLWALRKFAKRLGSRRPERSGAGRLLEEGAAMAAGVAMPGGPGVKWGARQVARVAIRSAVGIGESVGRVKLALARGLDAALTDGARTTLRRGPLAIDYSGEDRPSRDFNKKAADLRALASNPDALRRRLATSPATADVRGLDPDLAALAQEAAAVRLEALARALPGLPAAESYPAVESGTAPVNSSERSEWENRERVTADPADTAMAFVRAGAIPPEIIETLRETNPLLVQRLAERVMAAGPEALAAAPHATLLGLSKVLGVPLIPEADPMYRARAQERFRAKREANQEIQARQSGAAAIRGGSMIAPTPGQVMASPPPPVNLAR